MGAESVRPCSTRHYLAPLGKGRAGLLARSTPTAKLLEEHGLFSSV